MLVEMGTKACIKIFILQLEQALFRGCVRIGHLDTFLGFKFDLQTVWNQCMANSDSCVKYGYVSFDTLCIQAVRVTRMKSIFMQWAVSKQ